MKSISMLLLAGVSCLFFACNNDADSTASEDSLNNTTTTVGTTSDNTGMADVPAGTRTSFETKYPSATNVSWTRYRPDPAEQEDWMASLDTNDYVVNFRWNDADYWAWYDDGAWYRESTRVTDHASLPKAVNDAIARSYAGYTISEVEKGNDKNMTVYEVQMSKGSEKVKVKYDANGNVVKLKGPGDLKAKPDDN